MPPHSTGREPRECDLYLLEEVEQTYQCKQRILYACCCQTSSSSRSTPVSTQMGSRWWRVSSLLWGEGPCTRHNEHCHLKLWYQVGHVDDIQPGLVLPHLVSHFCTRSTLGCVASKADLLLLQRKNSDSLPRCLHTLALFHLDNRTFPSVCTRMLLHVTSNHVNI